MISHGAASRLLVGVLASASLALVSACGTTVDGVTGTTTSVASGSDGLGLSDPQSVPTAAPTDSAAPGSATSAVDSPSGAVPATNPGDAAPVTGPVSVPTVAASSAKRPLKIGILTTATSNAAAAGASYGNTVNETSVDQALVAAMNAHGGLAGHKIEAVYAHTDTGTTDWSTDFAAACATFTQDNHVDAVLGYEFGVVDVLEKCLTDKKIPHITTTQTGPDATTFRENPYFFSLATPSYERRSNLKIDGGLALGLLSSKSKLGIMTDSCPIEKRAHGRVVKPYIKSKGLTIASEAEIACPSGAADAAGAVTALQNAMVRFRSAGVDTILFDASSESAAALFAALFAQQQGYHPTYLLSSIVTASVLETNSTPKAQEAKMHVIGWQPSLDVRPSHYPSLGSAASRCLSLIRSQGVSPKAASDYYYAMTICDAFFAYEKALTLNGNQTNAAAVTHALEGFGSSFVSSTALGGLSSLAASRHDAPAAWRHVAWSDSCSCFSYTGSTHRF